MVPEEGGLKAIQRDGLDMIVFEIDIKHNAIVTKDSCLLDN